MAMADLLHPVTPGDILREDFLEPMGLSQAELARAADLTPACVSEVVNGKRAVTAEVDLRLCRYFGLSEGYWLRLQMAHDLMVARRRLGTTLDRIIPRADPTAVTSR
jgi:addiction module HigA family antidote